MPDPRGSSTTAAAIRPAPHRLPLLALVLATTLLVACTDGAADDRIITLDDGEQSTTAPDADEDAPGRPRATPPPGAPDTDGDEPVGDGDDAPDQQRATEPCGDELRTTLVATVDGQLDAIAEGAWQDALAFATDGFRADIDADRFRQIILDGFPVVADAVARDLGACRTVADQATMLVTVEDGDGTQQVLQYLFEQDEGGWGIGGAVPADDADPGRDEDTVTA